jgi:Cys-rich repeat protein
VQCTKSKDCATGLVCDTNGNSPFVNRCVQCARNSDCAAGEVCNSALVDGNLWQGDDQCQLDCRSNAGICTPGMCEGDSGICYRASYGQNYTDFDNCGNQVDAGWCTTGTDCYVDGVGGACNLGSQLCPFDANLFCFVGNNFGNGNGLGYCVPCTVDAGGCASPNEICISTGCDGPAGACVPNCFIDSGVCAAGTYCADAGPVGVDGGLVGVCDAGCQNSSNCGGATPICSAGSCVQCAVSADCPDWTPGCHNNLCNSCSQNSDCPGTEQCTGGRCGCSVNADCPLDVPNCVGQSSGYDGTCACTDSSQCGVGQICETRSPYAVVAAAGGACIAPCVTSADCATSFPGASSVCNSTTGYCVPCLTDQDCLAAADPSQSIAAPSCLLLGDGGYPNTSPPLLTGGGVCGCDAISQCDGGYTCVNPGFGGTCVAPCSYAGGIDSCFLPDYVFGYCPQDPITPYCNTFTGACQQCLEDYDCTSLYCGVSQCDGGFCM